MKIKYKLKERDMYKGGEIDRGQPDRMEAPMEEEKGESPTGNPDLDGDGTYSPAELEYHFDLNQDGKVTPDEYKQHVKWHARHPEVFEIDESALEEDCWKGYEAKGMKIKSGKKVPNCVPKKQNNEGVLDFVKKGLKKTSDVFKGVKDIGILGGGSTLLGGEEVFDIKKRDAKRDAAKTEIEGWLQKAGSGQQVDSLRDLYARLDRSGFPNNKEGLFNAYLKEVENTYNKIVDTYSKSQKTQDDAKATNTLIAILRGIVIYFQDFKIADKYLYLKEAEEKIGKEQGETSKNYAAAYGAKLPAGLALAGVSAMALGYNSDRLKNLLDKFKDMKDVSTETVQQTLQNDVVEQATKALQVGKGQGITQALGTAAGVDLSAKAPLSNLMDPKVQEYLESVKSVVVAKNGEAGGKAWDQILQMAKDPSSSSKSLGEIFKSQLSGTGKSVNDLLDLDVGSFQGIIKKAIQNTVLTTVRNVMKQPENTLKNQFINGVQKVLSGPVLTSLGLGALVGAGVSAGVRTKGKLSSRMNSIQQVVSSIKDVKSEISEDKNSFVYKMMYEKKDRCYRLAKQKYDVFPSAYASGFIVRCRKGKVAKKKK